MSHLEENAADAKWRQEQLSSTEARWAEEQRALRAHLVTTDQLDFAWPPATTTTTAGSSHASDPLTASPAVDESKSDSEAGASPPRGASAATLSTGVSWDESKCDSEAGSSPPRAKSTDPLRYIGGVDISFVSNGEEGDSDDACAALIVVAYPSMDVVYEDFEMVKMDQPYISGFLAFREVDHLLRLLNRLRARSPHLLPQLLMVDGNGVLHHRHFGLASHFGVSADLPTIGIGKNLLLVDGLDRTEVQERAAATLTDGGQSFPLVGVSGQTWGACLRSTKGATNPIYVSIGHRISLSTAVAIVAACCTTRIPTPVRLADLKSRDFIRKWKVAHPMEAAAGRAAAAAKTRANAAAAAATAPAAASTLAAAATSVSSSAGVAAAAAVPSASSAGSSASLSPRASLNGMACLFPPSSSVESKQDAESPARSSAKRRMSVPIISHAPSATSSSPLQRQASHGHPQEEAAPRQQTNSGAHQPAASGGGSAKAKGAGTYVPREITSACVLS